MVLETVSETSLGTSRSNPSAYLSNSEAMSRRYFQTARSRSASLDWSSDTSLLASSMASRRRNWPARCESAGVNSEAYQKKITTRCRSVLKRLLWTRISPGLGGLRPSCCRLVAVKDPYILPREVIRRSGTSKNLKQYWSLTKPYCASISILISLAAVRPTLGQQLGRKAQRWTSIDGERRGRGRAMSDER